MKAWLSKWFRPLAALVALAGLGWAFWSQRGTIGDLHVAWTSAVLVVALLAIAPMLQATHTSAPRDAFHISARNPITTEHRPRDQMALAAVTGATTEAVQRSNSRIVRHYPAR